MIDTRKKVIILFTGIFCFFGFLLLVGTVKADDLILRGKAYWQQYNYLYFSCVDSVVGNRLGQPGNLMGAGIYIDPPEPEEFHFYSEPCTDIVHQVTIGEDGVLSGKAWNPNFGLVSFEFNGFDPPDGFGSVNSNCSASCNPSRKCMACYNFETQLLYGWGRIENNNIPLADRWIKLHAFPPDNLTKIYTDDTDPSGMYPGANLELGDFAGTASSTYANIDFNCETEGYPGPNTCASTDYKVYIKNLVLTRLSAPNWTYTNACTSGAKRAVLRWGKMSGTQTAYEIVVNDSPTLSTTTGEYVCWTGKKLGSAQQHVIYGNNPSSECPNGNGLEYNTAYYWWLRGFDEDDEPTEWVQYNTNSPADSDGDRDDNPLTFQTFLHEFPHPFFNSEPEDIMTSTSTTFTSASIAYDPAEPNTPKLCTSFPALCTDFLWQTSDPSASISNPIDPETEITFYTPSNTSVTLTVTDATGYTCSASNVFRINYDLPLWREVKAQ